MESEVHVMTGACLTFQIENNLSLSMDIIML